MSLKQTLLIQATGNQNLKSIEVGDKPFEIGILAPLKQGVRLQVEVDLVVLVKQKVKFQLEDEA